MNSDPTRNVYVVGHTTPDTDSVCSAIAYAYFKNVTDKRFLFTPVRAGKLNHETTFVLESFGVPPSAEIDSLVATVSDLNLKRPIAVGVRDSVQALALLMREQGVRSVPVVDETGQAGRGRGPQGHRPPLYGQRRASPTFPRRRSSSTFSLKTLNGRVISNTKQAYRSDRPGVHRRHAARAPC